MTANEEILEARNAAAGALRDLSHAMISHDLDLDVLTDIETAAGELAAKVNASPERTHALTKVESFSMPVPGEKGDKATYLFADSIVSGTANPLGMNATLWRHEKEAMMKVTLGPGHEGAPGRAHGGLVAALIDETMGLVLGIIETPAFTGRLTITYRAPTPLGVELTGTARVVEQQGRKISMTAEICAGGELIAEGEALFIAVNNEQFIRSMDGINESAETL